MKIRLLFLVILAVGFIPGIVVSENEIKIVTSDVDLDFTLNQPKDSSTPSMLNRTVRISLESDTDEFIKVENARAEIMGNISGFSAIITPSKFSVENATTKEVTITYKADQRVLETDRYGPFTLTIGGTNLIEEDFHNLYVNIYYPDPKISVAWSDDKEWGNIRAGSSFEKKLIMNELMGYREARNVNVSLSTTGPVTLNYSGIIGDIQPYGTVSIPVNVEVDSEGLKPGRYNVTPEIISQYSTTMEIDVGAFTIPEPQINFSTKKIDFGRMTFETGKDISNRVLIVSETGNFTPIEDISFSLIFGPGGWFELPSDTRILPGEAKEFEFINILPSDTNLGEKNWQVKMDTAYAGSHIIDSKALVYFPGIEEAISYMTQLKVPENLPETETIRTNVITLLEEAKGQTEVDEIALVMRTYSSSRSFLNLMEEGSKPENQRAGRAIIQAKESLNKIQLGNDNIRDSQLKRYSSVIYVSSQEIWEKSARESLDRIQRDAAINEEINYKLSAINYKELAQLYGTFDEIEKQKEALTKQEEMEEKYKTRVLEANQRTFTAQDLLEESRSALLSLGDFGVLLNPFKYDMVFSNYDLAIENMRMADGLFLVAGEASDSVVIAQETEEVKKEKEIVLRSFVIFYTIIGIIYLWFILRVSLGIQRFRRDEVDNILGDVLLKVRK